MCTVVFIPKGDKFYFASLRDESPLRPAALVPEIRVTGNVQVLSPMDAKAGGTWIGITAYGSIIILLNGGFENHDRKTLYKKSRGLIVSELLASVSPVQTWNMMDMEAIEPFTLVVWMENDLYQLVWDGVNKHHLKLDTDRPYIWSSATLYDEAAKVNRKQLFNKWAASNMPVSALSLMNLFKSYPDNENGFLINRNGRTKTLSYSFIELRLRESAEFQYYDFLNFTHHSQKINFQGRDKKPAQPERLVHQ
jgi:uncharacterized protein with NRDE domain